jgi:uncharacterized protein (DUF934 family)
MQFIDPDHDPWRALESEGTDAAAFEPAAHLLLDLAQWKAAREHWPAGLPVGVTLANDAALDAVAADLARLDLVALQFPKFTDGRAYSQARLLRARHRYAGALRATGEVLVDMLPLLQRTGFDAVVLRADQSRAAAERALGFFAGHYQGDVREPRPLFARRAT